jgi:hypothetical protein
MVQFWNAFSRRGFVWRLGAFVCSIGLGVLISCQAFAIITRDDVSDSEYVVKDGDYPTLVSLISLDDCTGTLVHESYLLTVAHCAIDLKVGRHLTIGGGSYGVAEIFLHPRWGRNRDEFDIALVRLGSPVKNVIPLQIYRKTAEFGAAITLFGRGAHATGLQGEPGAQSDGRLRKATNVVSEVSDHFIGVVFERPGETGVTDLEGVGASGDSGGPSLIYENGIPYVAGLNSYGDGNGHVKIGQYGARDYQTRVSQYVDWLDSVIGLKVADGTQAINIR